MASWLCQSRIHREGIKSLGKCGILGFKVAPYPVGTFPKVQVHRKGSVWLALCQAPAGLLGQFLANLEVCGWTRSFGLISAGLSRVWGEGVQGGWLGAAGHRQLPQHRGALVTAEASRARPAWSPERLKVTQRPVQDSSGCCPAQHFPGLMSPLGGQVCPTGRGRNWTRSQWAPEHFLLAGARNLCCLAASTLQRAPF